MAGSEQRLFAAGQSGTDRFSREVSRWGEKGIVVLRHYGLYGRCGKQLRDQCRAELGRPEEPSPEVLTVEQYLEKIGHGKKLSCPICGEAMICVDRFGRARRAPRMPERKAA
jgi:hypothetical protein